MLCHVFFLSIALFAEQCRRIAWLERQLSDRRIAAGTLPVSLVHLSITFLSTWTIAACFLMTVTTLYITIIPWLERQLCDCCTASATRPVSFKHTQYFTYLIDEASIHCIFILGYAPTLDMQVFSYCKKTRHRTDEYTSTNNHHEDCRKLSDKIVE